MKPHNHGFPLTITPMDPHKVLPPPKAGTPTALVCDSFRCSHRTPHTTFYYQPKKTPTNIGIRCKHDAKYYRTYNIEWYSSEIEGYNTTLDLSRFLPIGRPLPLTRPPQPIRNFDSAADQIAKDHVMAMNLFNMLNGPGGPPTPPPTQRPAATQKAGGAPLPASQRCNGVHGMKAVGHNPKNNSQCPVNACFECCYQFNKGPKYCTKHSTAARRKYPSTTSTEEAHADSSRQSTSIVSNRPPEPRIPQPEYLFSRGVEGSSLNRFRSITIQDQANARIAKEGDEKVKKTVSLVVWPGTEPDPFACKVWRVLAPEWPKFALDHSVQLKKEVTNVLGADFADCLQVWNEDEKLWVLLEMDTLEQYTVDTRKILVAFPGVDTTKCKTVETHLASIAASNATDCRHMLHPAHRVPATPEAKNSPTSSEQSTPTARSSRWDIEDEAIILTTPQITPSDDEVDELATPRQNTSKRGRPSSDDGSEDDNGRPNWPLGATMSQMAQFFNLTVGDRPMINERAWKLVFGKTHNYVVSTVSKYQRWLEKIAEDDSAQLMVYVAKNGTKDVRAGQRHFKSQWDFVRTGANRQKKTKLNRFGFIK
ncbi:hypothetical protein DFH28DRAFT_1049340 [Melampsora americana]|nr:hypothetical protein DFH28DRAFT_1066294 [Melampsora americana]KAH9822136.1 hypothetical protein DFH28DRAFT_1049340 [Melampsora americana]